MKSFANIYLGYHMQHLYLSQTSLQIKNLLNVNSSTDNRGHECQWNELVDFIYNNIHKPVLVAIYLVIKWMFTPIICIQKVGYEGKMQIIKVFSLPPLLMIISRGYSGSKLWHNINE